MFKSRNKDLYLTEGDYGISIKLKLNKSLYETSDTVKFTIRHHKQENEPIINNSFDVSITDTEAYVILTITKEMSNKLPYGDYVYGLKHYRDDVFLNTIVKSNQFIVEKGV